MLHRRCGQTHEQVLMETWILHVAATVGEASFQPAPRTFVSWHPLFEVAMHEVGGLELVRVPSGHRVLHQDLVHGVEVREARVSVVHRRVVVIFLHAAIEQVLGVFMFFHGVDEVEVLIQVEQVALWLLYRLAHVALQHGTLVALLQQGGHGVNLGRPGLEQRVLVVNILLLLRIDVEITADDVERIIVAVHVLLQVVDESIVRAHSWTASCGLLVQLDLQVGLIKSFQNSGAATGFVGGRLVLV